MPYDTPQGQSLPQLQESQALMETMIKQMSRHLRSGGQVSTRGRPARVHWAFLSLGFLWCVLRGWRSQLDLWRLISVFGVADFAPVAVSDEAIYKRLGQSGSQYLQRLCAEVSAWLFERLAPYEDRHLAPFASEVLALDESTLDACKRWSEDLRGVPAGDAALLAGRLSCLFDIRRQQWRRIDWLPDVLAHCQVHAHEMLASVRVGALLLFDLGYYTFEWFDELTQRGIWWVSRMRERSSWTVEHWLVQREGYSEALVFLGAYRADRCAYVQRLIQYRYHGQWYRYLTNVLDPCQLSGAQVVQLYARRGDIELGFRVLKEHLKLRWICSAKPQVISAQLWAMVILAQMLHALQVEVAAGAGVDLFEVSTQLLLRHVPDLLRQGGDLGERLQQVGRALGLIRPSTRTRLQVPPIAAWEIIPVPVDMQWIRPPRYAHKRGQSPPGQTKTTSRKAGRI